MDFGHLKVRGISGGLQLGCQNGSPAIETIKTVFYDYSLPENNDPPPPEKKKKTACYDKTIKIHCIRYKTYLKRFKVLNLSKSSWCDGSFN